MLLAKFLIDDAVLGLILFMFFSLIISGILSPLISLLRFLLKSDVDS